LEDEFNIIQLFGILSIVIGLLLMNARQQISNGTDLSLFSLFLSMDKGSKLALLTAFLWTLNAKYDQIGAKIGGPFMYATIVQSIVTFISISFMIFRRHINRIIFGKFFSPEKDETCFESFEGKLRKNKPQVTSIQNFVNHHHSADIYSNNCKFNTAFLLSFTIGLGIFIYYMNVIAASTMNESYIIMAKKSGAIWSLLLDRYLFNCTTLLKKDRIVWWWCGCFLLLTGDFLLL